MKKQILFIGLAVMAVLFSDCKKDKVQVPDTISAQSNCASSSGGVYVATMVPSPSRSTGSRPTGLRTRTAIWNSKDKAIKSLSNNSAVAYAISVSGSDVYVAGSDGGTPVYWKNGVAIPLNDGTMAGEARGIVVMNNDVHVVGWQKKSSDTDGSSSVGGSSSSKQRAAYWKNGVCTFLPGELAKNNEARGIALLGNDVHIVGFDGEEGGQYGNAKYWVNGLHVELTDRMGQLYAIAISGKDIYIAGYEQHIAKDEKKEDKDLTMWDYEDISVATLWKNGKATYLSGRTKGSGDASANCLAVCESNVYVGGKEYIDTGKGTERKQAAVYWKNEAKDRTKLAEEGDVYGIAMSGNSLYAIGSETVAVVTKSPTPTPTSPTYYPTPTRTTPPTPRLWKDGNIDVSAENKNLVMTAIAAQ